MATAKKAAKKAAPKKTETKARSAFKSKTIHPLAKDNPHREGSAAHKQFSKYTKGLVVADALKKGLNRAYIYQDSWKGFIELK